MLFSIIKDLSTWKTTEKNVTTISSQFSFVKMRQFARFASDTEFVVRRILHLYSGKRQFRNVLIGGCRQQETVVGLSRNGAPSVTS